MTPASSSPVPPEDLLAHAGFVRGLARALVSGDADVDDIVQETWLAAVNSTGSQIRKPRSWLASIVRGRAARHHRTRTRMDKRHAEGATSVEVPTPDDVAARHETIQKVSAALASLPADYRDVLVLRYYEELPPREVARRLEIPVETARTRIRRGLVRLREILDERHDGRRAAWAAPLAGLVSSGAATAGIGAMVAVGLGVLLLAVAGAVFAPRLWDEPGDPRTQATDATDAADRSPEPPVLIGRHVPGAGARGDEPEGASAVSEAASPPARDATAPPKDGDPTSSAVLLRVLDEDDVPVEGIEILERYNTPEGRLTTRPIGRSDRDGVVRFVVPDREVVLLAGKSEEWHCGEVRVLPRDRQTPVFRMVRLTTVRGTVLTLAGVPSVGTRVFARYMDRSGVEGAPNLAMVPCDATDAEGLFTLRVPPYVRKVSLMAILREGGRVNLDFDPQAQAEVTLQPQPLGGTVLISGTVVDSEGAPLENCEVDAIPLDEGRSMGGSWDKGVFSEKVSAPGRYLILVNPSGATHPARPEPLEVTAPAEDLRIVCPPGRTLSGRLVDDDVSDFRVAWIRHRGFDPRLRVDDEVRSDESGAFALHGLTDGDSLLFACRDGDTRFGLVERPPLGEMISVVLHEGLSVSGRIEGYQGRHGFDLGVSFHWRGRTRYAMVEDDGTFKIAGLPPGSYRVGYERGDLRGDLDLNIEAGTEDVEVILPEKVLRMGQTPEK